MKAIALLLVLAAGAPAAARAAGGEAFDFLLLDANARPVALGGAYTALAADANALRYNPAGLGAVRLSEATFMHNQYLQGVTQEYLSYASRQGWGLSVDYLSWGKVARTTISQPDGTGGSFGINDLSVGAGYGRSFGEWSAGAGVKLLREQIDDVTGSGAAADAGVLYSPGGLAGLRLGAAVRNLGPGVKFQRARERLPLQGRLGAAYSFDAAGTGFTFAADATRERGDETRVGVGAEAVVLKSMALRLGFTTRSDAGLGITGGVGWTLGSLSVDYAIVPFSGLGIAHRVSLSCRWGC